MQEKLRCAIYTRVSSDGQVKVEFNSCKTKEENFIIEVTKFCLTNHKIYGILQ